MRELATLAVRDIGSFFIGGTTARLTGRPLGSVKYAASAPPLPVNPNGTYVTGQIYVQYVLLADPIGPPILFLNGGTSSAAMWETTPDGRPGWQRLMLAKGRSTYLTDAVGKGRASFAPYPEIYQTGPVYRPSEETWALFRIGPIGSSGRLSKDAFPGVQFPVTHFGELMKQGLPRFTGHEKSEVAAYESLLERIGPCIVIAQSSGGYLATRIAAKRPDLFKAIVTVELTAAPDLDNGPVNGLTEVPQLLLWGDNTDAHPMWSAIKVAINGYAEEINRRGGTVDIIDLPARGMVGNTHQMMMDLNNDTIFEFIADWIDRLPYRSFSPSEI